MNLKNNNKGFTLVELLIVIVIIAILAAISIVAYNGITDRANNSAAKDTAAQFKTKAEVFKQLDNDSNYPTDVAAFETQDESKLGDLKDQNTTSVGGIKAKGTPVSYKTCNGGKDANIAYYNSKAKAGDPDTITANKVSYLKLNAGCPTT